MTFTMRRAPWAALIAVIALTVLAGPSAAYADAAAAPKPMGTTDMAKALTPGPLAELSVGDAAGVPVIEYGSVTCSHCAHFAHDV